MGAVAAPLAITDEQRDVLMRWVRAQHTPQRLVLRTRIVLMAGDGHANSAIARTLGTTRSTVLLWRRRFAERGPMGLVKIAAGRGRRPSIPSETVQRIIDLTLHGHPEGGATSWSCRAMGRAAGVSADTVSRIWREHGLQPHRLRTFKLSNDPRFVAKLIDIAGLYVNPPDHALAFCVDERCQLRTMGDAGAGRQLRKWRHQATAHDYRRTETASFLAALRLLERYVPGEAHDHRRHREFVRFLHLLEHKYPPNLELHLILDDCGTHKRPDVQAWLKRRPHINLHFVPAGSSWLNLIEKRLIRLITKAIHRGSLGSMEDLMIAIDRFVRDYHRECRPFVWTAAIDSIL